MQKIKSGEIFCKIFGFGLDINIKYIKISIWNTRIDYSCAWVITRFLWKEVHEIFQTDCEQTPVTELMMFVCLSLSICPFVKFFHLPPMFSSVSESPWVTPSLNYMYLHIQTLVRYSRCAESCPLTSIGQSPFTVWLYHPWRLFYVCDSALAFLCKNYPGMKSQL